MEIRELIEKIVKEMEEKGGHIFLKYARNICHTYKTLFLKVNYQRYS